MNRSILLSLTKTIQSMKRYPMKVIDRWKRNQKLKKDADVAKNQGLAQGYAACTEDTISSVQKLNSKLCDLTSQINTIERTLRENYKQQLKDLEDNQKRKCEVCSQGISAERRKLHDLQNQLQTALFEFQEHEKRLIAFISTFEITFNNILNSSGKLKNSQLELSILHKNVEEFTKKFENLIEMNAETV